MSFLSDKKNYNLLSRPLACVASKLATKQVKNVITIAGAGISTSAGISDFRSPETGLYNKLRKYNLQFADVMLDKNYFLNHPETLYSILNDNFLQNPLKPTLTHCFIKLLETKGVLLRHFTQNIDGMELMTGLSRDKLVEAHGTLHRSYCIECKQRYDFQWLCSKMVENPVPYCDSCGGLVRPDITLFGEQLCKEFELRAFVDLPQCDLLIILGTTLQVEPFASIVNSIPSNCPRLIVSKYNLSEFRNSKYQKLPRYDKDVDDAMGYDAFLLGDCDSSVRDLVGMIGWEDDLQRVVEDVKMKKMYGDVAFVDVAIQTLPISPDAVSDCDYLDEDFRTLKCANYRMGPKVPPMKLSTSKPNGGHRKTKAPSPEKRSVSTPNRPSLQILESKKLPRVDQKLLKFCNRCTIQTVCDN